MPDTMPGSRPTPRPVRAAQHGAVGVLGTGVLSTALRAVARATWSFGCDEFAGIATDGMSGPGCGALAVVTDADDIRPYPAVRRDAVRWGVPWLPVRVEGSSVLIGPVVQQSVPGCPTCMERRRTANRPDGRARTVLRKQYGEHFAERPSPLLTAATAYAVAAVAACELDRLRRGDPAAYTRGALLRYSLTTGLFTRHLLLPVSGCPDCSPLPEDRPEHAVIRLCPRLKPDPETLRTRRIDDRWPQLAELYVDGETGVIASVESTATAGCPTAVARLGPAGMGSEDRHGYGRAADLHSARLTAVTEALERLGGQRPRGRRTAVRAPYAEVAEKALDPRSLGLYPDDWYDRPGFHFTRFDPRQPVDWVWGYSFTRARPVLVPERCAYYGVRAEGGPMYAAECSSGCALGGCLEEAVLHGLLEIAERDAALTGWYTRMPARRLDLDAARDRHLPLLAEHIRQRYDYRVSAFSITLEQRIPTVWVMAVDQRAPGGRMFQVSCTAAHPDPERALRAALFEIFPHTAAAPERWDAEAAARMLADSGEVRHLRDHSTLYGHHGAFPRLDFLRRDSPAIPPAELARQCAWPRYHDLSDDLAELVHRYLDTGLDVIAVDTTSLEQRAGGFAGAKVIVPGTVPMTFGHRYRRTHGIPRLSTVPQLLGHRAADLPPQEFNPHPHPFL